jgi:hypothetical protein
MVIAVLTRGLAIYAAAGWGAGPVPITFNLKNIGDFITITITITITIRHNDDGGRGWRE